MAQKAQSAGFNSGPQLPGVADKGGNGFQTALESIGNAIADLFNGIGDAIGGFFEGLFSDEGALPLLFLVLLILVIVAVVGGWVYLIAFAPEILGEVALQFLFSSAILPGLRPAMRYAKGTEEMDHAPWINALIKKTVIPGAMVLIAAVGLGFTMNAYNPKARTLREFIEQPLPEAPETPSTLPAPEETPENTEP